MSEPSVPDDKLSAENFSIALARMEQAKNMKATRLILSGLKLFKIPDDVGQLTQLQTLNLRFNHLTTLPETIDRLINLELLDFTHNQLKKVPEAIGRLSQLKTLYLYHNQLTEVPETISRLTQLQILYLSHNQLMAVPEAVVLLSQLQQLDLSDNQLTIVSSNINRLVQLQQLYLQNNRLSLIPDTIGQLPQLQLLDLSNNHLTSLPETFKNLRSLQELYLHGNYDLNLPVEVLGPTREDVISQKEQPAKPSDILDYYFRTRGGKRPLNEAKLILVGRGAVGKTSLVNRLVHNKFVKDEKKTEGINITNWKLQINGNEDVRLNIWDFGGQEIMHATHQFFLTQRSLYLLVLKGREGGEDADAEYWLKLIESFGGDSPVIVVLNKIKEHPFDLNRHALQQKYPIREFIKTDCEDGTGIAELHKIIARETDRLPDLRAAFPANWFTIKEQLAGMKKNYVGFEEYRSFCEQHGEHDKAAQEALAGYLHTLGIVLNYKDDPRLQDTHVLNPHWVTNGIYKVLNADKLEKQHGEIRLSELAEIFDEINYPVSMRRFIFDLMKKFDLGFSFPDDETHYLIPELLDKQEPAEAAEFQPEACLNFQYHYSVLPEGLLPRFIVRTHVLSENLPRWRSGAILKFEGCRALVKADVQDKKVFISVSGPTAARRRLLAIIRSDFDRIHRDIRNLQPQEMVPLPNHPEVTIAYQKLLVREQKGTRSFTEIVGDDEIELQVQELLNGVDLEGTRRTLRTIEEAKRALRLVYSYSHKDENLLNELETHLKLLQRQGMIETWHGRRIEAGEKWKRKIDENFSTADIILLMVSADFMASDYCYEIEMKLALERHEKGEAQVIPVIVRDCNWRVAPFAKLQALPKEGKAVKKWPDKDSAWRNVAEGIERVVEEMRKQSMR